MFAMLEIISNAVRHDSEASERDRELFANLRKPFEERRPKIVTFVPPRMKKRFARSAAKR